jgi:hypothetical protein
MEFHAWESLMNRECTGVPSLGRPPHAAQVKDFNKNKSKKSGLQSRCRVCVSQHEQAWRRANEEKAQGRSRAWRKANPEKVRETSRVWARNHPERVRGAYLRRKYGITLEDWVRAFRAQNGCCAICGDKFGDDPKKTHVDHDHKTGEFRKLLCRNCNIGLGMFKSNPEFLRKAIDYLWHHKTGGTHGGDQA